MKKIPSLFERDWEGDRSLVVNKVTPGAEWVVEGEGVATVKWDGTAVMVRGGVLYKRYDAKYAGAPDKKWKTPPPDFEPAQDPDPITGHWPGWVPVGLGPEDRWLREAFLDSRIISLSDGTYEAVGPKINGNPYGDHFQTHVLIPHGNVTVTAPRTFEELVAFFDQEPIEGVVWHHPDGRMVKIKRRDFGLTWPIR